MATKVPPTKSQPKLRTTAVKTWALPDLDEVFVQDPLTFFEKGDFFALVSRALERAISSGYDLRGLLALIGGDEKQVEKLFAGEAGLGATLDELGLMMTDVLGLVMRVLSLAPGVMEEAYLLILSVPPERHELVRPALRKIDDDTGFGIFETFVDQNKTTLLDFLGRWREQLAKTTEAMKEGESTEGS